MKIVEIFSVVIWIMVRNTLGLTIDNQLVIIANDCYTRIAIGSTLASKDITSSVTAVTVTECEDECSKKRSTCEIFSFGISSKGNASCLLGTSVPNAEDLVPHPDFDIYIRQQSSPNCMPDRLYKLGSGQRNPISNGDKQDHEKGGKTKPGRKPTTQSIIPGPGGFGTVLINRPNSEDHLVVVSEEKRPGGTSHKVRPNFSGYQVTEDASNHPEGYGNQEGFDPDNPNVPYGHGDKNYGGQGYGHDFQHFYHVEHQEVPDFGHDDYYLNDGQGNRYGTDYYETPLTVSCYRKLFAGKRLAEIHIRRAVDCERIDECSRECDAEKGFSCEGFNYRHPGSRGSPRGRVRGTCELTSMPPSRIDVVRDIVTEPRYDYYERELGCDKKRPEPRPQSGWHDLKPQGDPYFHQRPVEVPRPLIPDRRPERPFHPRPGDNWNPESHPPTRVPGISIRPIEDDVRFEYFRPGRPYLPEGPKFWRPRPQGDFGPNEVDHHRHPGRRKDAPPGHGVYGGSYGYDTNYIDVPIRGTPPSHDKRPLDNPGNGIYGEVYNYGGAFGYGENYAPVDRDVVYGGSGRPDLCSVRSGAGFKLRRGIVRKSYLTPSLDHCENLCAVEKDCVCMTFSYRYSVAANSPTDNCLLSEVSYRDLDFYNDLEPDRDYDIYSMTGDHKSCGKERPANERPPEECFWRVRSGCGVPPEVIRKTIVAQGLGDCEAECVEARQFTCRSFVYRYSEAKPSHDESPNCFLSDWPSQEIDPLALPEVDGAELYQRGSFGRGCEPHPFPPLNNRGNRPGHSEPDNRPAKKDEVCYAEYQKPSRLTPEAVMKSCYVRSESECRERCSEMRDRDPVPCMSFSYRTSNDRNDHNCHMSDVPRRDLRPGIDYVFGDGYLLFAWKEFEPHCDSGYSINIFIDDDRNSGRRPSHERPERPDYFEPPFKGRPRPHGRPYPPQPDFGDDRSGERPYGHGGGGGGGYGYGQDSRPGGHPHGPDRPDPVGPSYGPGGDRGMIDSHGFHGGGGGYGYGQDSRPGDRPHSPDRPDPVGPSYGPGGDRGMIDSHGFYGGGGGGGGSYPDGEGRFGHGYSDERYNDVFHKHAGSTFEHFTVNGRPCRRGTKCERNKIAGFWSCEPEGAEYGSWDYCCEPKHHCGYSQGYHYPWCYVGPYEDQWRPCSEKYYPHTPSSRPPRPSSDRWDEDSHGEVPRPGLLGRHWPVAYLHSESPPNATDHRLRVSEDRRDRELLQGTGSGESKSTPGNNRSGKVERISRSRGGSSGRNFKAGKSSANLNDSRIRDSEIPKLADLTEDLEAGENETKSGDDSDATTFVRIPTITPNETREGKSKFEDYFEIVDV